MSFRTVFITMLAVVCVFGAERQPGKRTTPPTLEMGSPRGVPRGARTEVVIEGLNLAGASRVYFSQPGVTGRIVRVKEIADVPENRLGAAGLPSTVDLGPLPPRYTVTIEVEAQKDAMIGPVAFRVHTTLGTTPSARIAIEPELPEVMANADRPPSVPVLARLTGAITTAGQVDVFRIKAAAAEEVSFYNAGVMVGSTLSPVVAILDAHGKVLHETAEWAFSYRFDTAGEYSIHVADALETAKPTHFYRIAVGSFPLVASAYPLGIARGKTQDVALQGANVPATIRVQGKSTGEDENLVVLRPDSSLTAVRLALGDDPETAAAGSNIGPASAQALSLPITVNGRLDAEGHPQYFRFRAQKGQNVNVEVNASRLGSKLDSVVDVLDAAGRPIERATVRAVSETATTLGDRDSRSTGIRLLSWAGMNVGDHLMIGEEIIRIRALPKGPDEDVFCNSFGGQRIAFFDTTPEAHAQDKPVYKVELHPPGARFAPNGLPLVRLYYRNDDGGPAYGKDSLVHFVASAEGDYIVRLADTRGAGASEPYRLTLHEPRPDFRVSVTPRNPNVPAGGTVPLTVTAMRTEFDGPIDVELTDLPSRVRATRGLVGAGQDSATILLSADSGAKLAEAAPLKVKAQAKAGERILTRWANPEDRLKLIAVVPPADVATVAETKVVEVEPGKRAQVSVSIKRQNGFEGRIPIEVRNLPPSVSVTEVGLNGVLINEDEDRRTFTIEALASAEPIEQYIYLSADVETRSPQPSSYAAPEPVLLRIRPATLNRASAGARAGGGNP